MPYKRSGSKKWWIIVKGVRQSSGTEIYEDAEALENRLNLEIWKQQHMGVKPPKSWMEAVVKHLGESKHLSSYDSKVQRLAWWDNHLRRVNDLRAITRDFIDGIIQKHMKLSPEPASCNTTANKYVIQVAAVLNAAAREWSWIESAPKLRRYPEPDHQRNWLRPEEWFNLERELPDHLKWPALFALATGMRAGKLFALEWSQIDMQKRYLTFTGNKHKRGNTIPLNHTAMRVLEHIRASDTVHLSRVFQYQGEPLNDYGDAFYKAMERAGLGTWTCIWEVRDGKRHRTSKWEGRFTWHGFRHTFASWLGQAGCSAEMLDQLCGWAEKDTRSIYTHLNVEPQRQWSEVIDTVLRTFSAQCNEMLVDTSLAA